MADDIAQRLEQHIPALRRYAFALTRDRDAGDDLVQDCLERALSRLYLRRHDGDLRAWLFTLMRNLYLDAYRSRARRGGHVSLDEVAPHEAGALGAPAAQDGGLEARDALKALDLLPEEQKSLLLLVGVEDLTYQEAARVVGVPLGTVMSRLARARARLRALIDGTLKGEEAARGPVLRRVK